MPMRHKTLPLAVDSSIICLKLAWGRMVKFYWSEKSIPELACRSPKERKEAWMACFYKPLANWRFILAVAFCICLYMIVLYLSCTIIDNSLNHPILHYLISCFFGFIFIFTTGHFYLSTMRPHVIKYFHVKNQQSNK